MTDGQESSDEQTQPRSQRDTRDILPTQKPSQKEILENSALGLGSLSPKVKRIVKKEFKDWKQTLVTMIHDGSRIQINRDGSVSYILPPKIVKLVWITTIKERVNMFEQQGSETPVKDAFDALRGEVAQAIQEELADEE